MLRRCCCTDVVLLNCFVTGLKLLCRYNEYHKCVADPAKTEQDCSFFQRAYRAMCPNEWVSTYACWLKGFLHLGGLLISDRLTCCEIMQVERWNEQREAGTWPGKY